MYMTVKDFKPPGKNFGGGGLEQFKKKFGGGLKPPKPPPLDTPMAGRGGVVFQKEAV